MKDFGCDRDRYIILWKRNPMSLCVTSKNMKRMITVEELSRQLMTERGFNLDSVSTRAAWEYIRIRDQDVKMAVLNVMETALKTETNPITGQKFTTFTLTKPLMKTIICHEWSKINQARRGKCKAR